MLGEMVHSESIVKEAIETITTNSAGNLVYPTGRKVIAARMTMNGGTYNLFVSMTGAGDSLSRYYIDGVSGTSHFAFFVLPENTPLSVQYMYIDS